MISWKSQDGTTIEGVLIKPTDFSPVEEVPAARASSTADRRASIARPCSTRATTPSTSGSDRGALVLKVNYRGSAGYGEKFRELNVRNLGVGDAWDVLSGVERLVAKGWVDPARVGCMGWSQGGYISAFLTTSTTAFAAVSVGAGISNWATYYYNTDITPFTIQYLGANPADDPAIYAKTSPMTYIKQAKTPTLIQHGENDRRVPDSERLRAAAGPRGSRRAGGDGGLQGLRPRDHEAEGDARGDAAQPRVVQPLHLRRRGSGARTNRSMGAMGPWVHGAIECAEVRTSVRPRSTTG